MRTPLIERLSGESVASTSVILASRRVKPGELWIVREFAAYFSGSSGATVGFGFYDEFGNWFQLDSGTTPSGTQGASVQHYLLLREGERAGVLLYSSSSGIMANAAISGWIITPAPEIVVAADATAAAG